MDFIVSISVFCVACVMKINESIPIGII